MYFWKIDKLKEELKAGGLNQRQLFLYILIFVLLYQFFLEIGFLFPAKNAEGIFRYMQPIIDLISVGIGTYWCFYANGSSGGKKFAERYFSIGFVVGMRFALIMFIPVISVSFFIGILAGLGTINSNGLVAKLSTSAVMTLYLFVFYWRMAVHINDVAKAGFTNA